MLWVRRIHSVPAIFCLLDLLVVLAYLRGMYLPDNTQLVMEGRNGSGWGERGRIKRAGKRASKSRGKSRLRQAKCAKLAANGLLQGINPKGLSKTRRNFKVSRRG